MPPARVALFASLEEQAAWLSQVASTWEGWCAWPDGARGSIAVGALSDAAGLLGVPDQIPPRLFLGRSDLAGPVWRIGGAGRALDMEQSRAVQFVPSVRRGSVLLEGRLDILRVIGATNDPGHISTREWFNELRHSLLRAWYRPELRVNVRSEAGAVSRAAGRVIVTPHALAWYQNGGALKQFEAAPLSFVLENKERVDEG